MKTIFNKNNFIKHHKLISKNGVFESYIKYC